MPSKQQAVAKYDISPVLFMTVDGEPMSFFLRPGPIKRKLQPLITAGGGLLCNVQQPGAHLLIDPKERGSIAETTAHWYVSIQYIHDCIEKGEQLNLEDYRLIPEVVPRHSARLNSSKEGSPGLGGRVAFTSEEDAAILSYVSKHLKEIGGNRLWQEMEKQHVTSHSWQSMKYRYRARLAKRQSEIEKVKTSEEDSMEEGNQDTDIQMTLFEKDAVPPLHSPSADPLQTHATETDLRQIYAQPTQNTSENTEAQPFSSVQEVQPVNPQTEVQTGESARAKTAETETSKSLQTEGSCLDPHTDVSPIPAESAEPETVDVPTIISPQNDSMPEDSLRSLPDSTTTPTNKKASPKLDNTAHRRITRRQLEQVAQSSPEPYGKKHRSSLATAEKPSSPQPLRKTKLAVKSTLQNNRTIDQPPSKRARAQRDAAESPLKESEKTAVSETPQPDETSNSLPQKGEKKKEQKKLGILEMATKEFEDESESGEDEAAVPPNTTETGTMQPTSSEHSLAPPDTAADPSSAQTNPEPGPSLQTDVQEAQASTSKHVLENACADPTADEAAHVASRAHLFIFNSESQEDDSQSVVGVSAAGHVASKPHMFIFNSESQEKDSQSVVGESAAGHVASRAHMFIFNCESQEKDSKSLVRDGTAGRSQPAVNAAFSLTETQLEEDKQRISELMNQTNKDLISVTKALLKTSGDFCAAQKLLLNPSSISGPFWKRSDDDLLLSADPAVRQQLQDKYGEVGFAKRILFLEAEG